MTHIEPQGEARWAKFDMGDVRIRQSQHRHTPGWQGAYLWCLRHGDEESAHLIRLRNDHDYAERIAEGALAARVLSPLRSCAEIQSEQEESEAA